MYYLYYLFCNTSDTVYVGFTNNLKRRLSSHKSSARNGKKSALYDAMRKHGQDNYKIFPFKVFVDKQAAFEQEAVEIAKLRQAGVRLLNLADGGEGGYVIPAHKREEWRAKLSEARQGKKPALGMRHTEENKRFFAECNKRKVLSYPDLDPLEYSFKEANDNFGISKTHYYRLLKRAKSNDLG